jgi:hypothetical protein
MVYMQICTRIREEGETWSNGGMYETKAGMEEKGEKVRE